MSAAASRSADLLSQIAALLDVPVTTFTAPPEPPAEVPPAAQVATLVFDPEGQRLAAAFTRLPRHARTSLANVAEALASDVSNDRAPLHGPRS